MVVYIFVVERLEYVEKSGKSSQGSIIRTKASLRKGVFSTSSI